MFTLLYKHGMRHCDSYFAPYLKNGSKIFLSNARFVKFFNPMFANCVNTKTMFVHGSEQEIFFSLSCCKFAVECDWNRKNSQKVQNLSFFGKIDGYFRKKTLNFFKTSTSGKFSLECISNGIFFENVFPLFFSKNQSKIIVGKVILLKGIFINVGGRKISRR